MNNVVLPLFTDNDTFLKDSENSTKYALSENIIEKDVCNSCDSENISCINDSCKNSSVNNNTHTNCSTFSFKERGLHVVFLNAQHLLPKVHTYD